MFNLRGNKLLDKAYKLCDNENFDFFFGSSSSGVFGRGLSMLGEQFDVVEQLVLFVDVVDIEPDVDEVEFVE